MKIAMFLNKNMDTQIVADSYHQPGFSHQKERTTDAHNLDESQKRHTEWQEPGTNDTLWLHLYEI